MYLVLSTNRTFPHTPWAKLERNGVKKKGTELIPGNSCGPDTQVGGDKTVRLQVRQSNVHIAFKQFDPHLTTASLTEGWRAKRPWQPASF